MKRIERFNYNSVAKKPKIQEDNDDVWGDDIEFDEIDKCITLASQQQETQSSCANNNITLQSYDNFKIKANVCSTQAFLPPPLPSTSKNYNFKQKSSLNLSNVSVSTVITKNLSAQEYQQKLMHEIKKLEEQNKKLTENYETKDGEISILRSQLKQAQKVADNEKMQKLQQLEHNQQQWNDKFNAVAKEKENMKCELDLKQLEIINLKELIRDLKNRPTTNDLPLNPFAIKDNNLSQKSFRSKRSSCSTANTAKKTITCQTDIMPSSSGGLPSISQLYYPLQKLIPESFFEKSYREENAVIKLKNSFDGANLLRHSSTQYENIINFKLPEINKIVLSAEYFFTELIQLMKCSNAELNYSTIIPSINKIILVTRELLLTTLKQLRKAEQNISNEDVRDMNTQYLYGENFSNDQKYCIFSGMPWSENELGIELRKCLAVLSALAMHSLYLLRCITDESTIKLNEDQYYPVYSKLLTETYSGTNTASNSLELRTSIQCTIGQPLELKCDILNIILDTIQVIGKIRRSQQFSGFLASVLTLITSILNQDELTIDCYSVLHSIFQQIVFARPSVPVLKYLSTALRQTSFHRRFVLLLCKNSSPSSFRRSKDYFMFSEDTCTFQIVAVLLEIHKKNVYFAYDIINFLHNALTNNSTWIYPQEQRCECLFKVYCASIEVLYELMQDSLKTACIEENVLRIYHGTFQIGLTVISVLTYRSPDLIIGCLRLYAQYLDWIKRIQEFENNLKLESNQIISLETLLLYISNDAPCEEIQQLTEPNELYLTQEIQSMKIL